jgi:ketosteroid isomerase-like protein
VALTKTTVQAWLSAYARAWEPYDPEAVGDLFSEDAIYLYHPFDEGVRGRLAIVASWVDAKDPPGTYEGSYEPVAVDGNVAVAHGRSRYFTDASKSDLVRQYDNIFVMEFGDDGRCQSFREWYMRPPGQKEPA